ncbi:bifunctional adenosylcobinamide kinase/adenosylcobinamide-phosphate guanylyltransferase [Draconibacterium sp. IB214405]|uniref:bifunctional adenosylcobinamide kinase/adenosylcobinamide-phosphate guanylyltransferase n=1 Tax=Draconibacterium sp. IB214405 TaxID=3097352 RepID=UPI002A13D2EF|nr:bifunctional adenosylcobinamide kinase/adenosylcobinamide-phosphate guanylyltransferase [Draconibacterium sp. IB214405]MDX8341079.1 bifunctional adenosylcobinamide kinase/adenosylcobinamide-phosphate guanylyltransferase [Draconibacterium sp. IB214405]
MAQITFITGGQRSGKSSFAQKRAEENSDAPVYLATAHIWDEDFHNRVKRHQSDRCGKWTTIEEEIEISKHDLAGKTVILDCVTLWLTNIFYQNKNDVDTSLEIAKREWDKFINQEMELFVVSNELGMGVHPENEIARKFADLQGWMNQYIAKTANEVFLMVSGIPVQVKRISNDD